jgi:hypothetical protein
MTIVAAFAAILVIGLFSLALTLPSVTLIYRRPATKRPSRRPGGLIS